MVTPMAGRIRVGIGGWVFAPWRHGVFYPEGLPQSGELAYAARNLTSIEINGTFYSTFKPATWRKWASETPEDFVFAVKGSRYVTNRRELATAGPSVDRFVNQGLAELGNRLGPVNWQLPPTKRFDAADVAAFLALLPRQIGAIELRHAIEARHPSFDCDAFVSLTRAHGVAIVHAKGAAFPAIDATTAPFSYMRLMITREQQKPAALRGQITTAARLARRNAEHGDVFVYIIAGAKERNPAAALALIRALASKQPAGRPR